MGGPLTSAGHLERMRVDVRVRDESGRTVRFDADGVARSSGEYEMISITPAQARTTITLPPERTYEFTADVFDEDGNRVAHATSTNRVALRQELDVVLQLETILGAAHLAPRLPTRQLLPGQEIDVMLHAFPPGRPDLTVPTVDFQASYYIANGIATASSNRGLRVRAGQRSGGDLVIRGNLKGTVLAGDNVAAGTITADLHLRFSSSLSIDLEPPSITQLSFDPVTRTLTGAVDDDFGVARVDVYDGPLLLASTGVTAADLPGVVFSGGGVTFTTLLTLSSGIHSVTLLALDRSGNEARAELEVTIP